MNAKVTSWGQQFKKALDAKSILVALVVLGYLGEKVWDLVKVGAEVEFQNKIIEAYNAPAVKEAVKAEFKANITDPAILKDVLNSPEVGDFSKEAGDKIEKQIVSNVLKEDSTKISMVGGLGKKSGIRNDEVLDKMADLLKAWDKGEIMTKDQADLYIKKVLKKNIKASALKQPNTASF